MDKNFHHGIRCNLSQFTHQLLQVLLVGLTIGMTRTVVPALAESDFGVPRNSFVLLSSFVVAFGLVKATMNFIAGRLSESIGRDGINADDEINELGLNRHGTSVWLQI